MDNIEIAKLLDMYLDASLKFVNKVDKGEARSTETYNDLKKCIEFHKQLIEKLRN